MTKAAILAIWLAASFAAAFVLSLFHACLGSLSKISLSRSLEDRAKDFRTGLVQDAGQRRAAHVHLVKARPRGHVLQPAASSFPQVVYYGDVVPGLKQSVDHV